MVIVKTTQQYFSVKNVPNNKKWGYSPTLNIPYFQYFFMKKVDIPFYHHYSVVMINLIRETIIIKNGNTS